MYDHIAMNSSFHPAACYDEGQSQSVQSASSDNLPPPRTEKRVQQPPPPPPSTSQPSLPHAAPSLQPVPLTCPPPPPSPPPGPRAEVTQPQSVAAPQATATALPDSERVQKVAHEATQLQDQFVRVLTHTKITFSEKTAGFLGRLQITLTTLPLSNKFKRLCFLKEIKEEIKSAKSVPEIFELLEDYWNYGDYALLHRLVQEFGDSALQSEMGEYVAALERFEKGTTIQDFSRAKPGDRDAPYDFSKAVLQLNKDPSKCTLYEVRQLVESLATSACLDQYVMFLSGHSCGSVIIKLAFPRVALDLIISALNKAFQETHQIVSVAIDEKPLEEYSEEHVKVCATS